MTWCSPRGCPCNVTTVVPDRPWQHRGVVVSRVTRGTTGVNRLRRVDRWVIDRHASTLRAASSPLVVDLGFGASPTTTLELAQRLAGAVPRVEVIGVEVDPARVAVAQRLAAERLTGRAGAGGAGGRVRFVTGGFDLAAVPGLLSLRGARPTVVRAANVLRQYGEHEVAGAWAAMAAGCAAGGVIVDATCDEVGRRAAWVEVAVGEDLAASPISLTLSLRLAGLERPSEVAPRLPKVLIHRNVPGEGVHAFLAALDSAWERAAPLGAFGARQRWVAACRAVADAGWPLLGRERRWRLGEVGVAWPAVAPSGARQ